ncbi:MAG: hypothetical protein CVT90_03055 [Candidatus Altiarchaeales archaeon HGW-Altiarchaeales-3]|nr:MAG: hypothetical protein CVT90_03055 [Candidatus Altiarchaeales archaeon HGW-Altiarchaeales-3]
MLLTLIISTTILFLAAASYYDLKTGEIPDKISIGLVAAILILSIFQALTESPGFLINAVLFGTLYFAIGCISFYFGHLGGGDVKLLAGIGCSVANIPAGSFIPDYLVYFIDAGIVVMPYMAIYGLILGFKNKTVFFEFAKEIRTLKIIMFILLSFIPMFMLIFLAVNIEIVLIILCALLPVFVLLTIYLKIVEKKAMQRTIPVFELTKEDTLAEDIIFEGEKIAKKNDVAGLTKEQVDKIKELAKGGRIPDKITIKWGIKFVPVLFIGFLIFVFYGNVIEVLFI